MSSDTHDAEPAPTRMARRRRERRKRRLLAAGAVSGGLACSGLLIAGMVLSGGDTEVDVADPPPPPSPHEASASPSTSQAPVADGQQQSSAEARAPSATPAEPSPEESEQAEADGRGQGGAGAEGPDGGTAPQGTQAGGEEPSGSGAEPSGGCAVGYSVTNEWSSGFQAEVTVSADAPINGWRVAVDFPDGQRIHHAWNAEVSGGGGSYTASDVGRNGELAAGESTAFGFIGSARGDNGNPRLTCTPA
ncbi:cellulose binding domain-containing protein [Streptomonospora arabica]|uniref:Cellulose binding domain-containing protein n=1 Tax=Streptomonospora arabica TaxID=412417 RepID=A0ABV9SIF2_9ACTN